MSGAVLAVAVSAIVAVAVTQAHHPPASSCCSSWRRSDGAVLLPLFDRYSLIWIGGAFMLGGALSVAFARGWRSMFLVDAVGFAIAFGLMLLQDSSAFGITNGRPVYGWFFWVFGVSAGFAVRGRIRRHLPTLTLSPPPSSSSYFRFAHRG